MEERNCERVGHQRRELSALGKDVAVAGVTLTYASTVGTFKFTLRVRSGDDQAAVRELNITVIFDGPALTVRTRLLPPGVVGLPYGPVIEANGGSGAPVTWVLTSGTLPPGVRLEAEGSFSGQPTVPGTFTFSVLAYGGGVANVTFTVSIVAMDGSRFDITRLDVTPVPGGVEPHVLAAIARWESVIVGDLSEDSVPRGLFGSGDCSGFAADLNGASIEDLLILVNVDSIDGPGGTLGQAGPCGRRDDNIPAIGALTLDKDDLDPYVGTQTLTDIVFHEIGHILGFGTIWDGHGCTPGTSGCYDYLQDDAGSDPTFTGPNAVLEWRSLGGVGDVPVEATGGPGTALAHWRESTFDAEMMTGFVERTGVTNPLSRVTIASLDDLRYRVSLASADDFALPPASSPGAAIRALVGWEEPLLGPVRTLPRR